MAEEQTKRKKIISFIACEPGQDRARFRERFLDEFAPRLVVHLPRAERLVVNLVDVEATIKVRTNTRPPFDVIKPPYDVVTEMWVESFDDFKDPMRRFDTPAGQEYVEDQLKDLGARVYDYLISERTQWNRGPTPKIGERTPGVKALMPSRRIESMAVDNIAQRWLEHRLVAEKHHVGAIRYLQNGVLEALTPSAEVMHGIAELYFPTIKDLEERFFDSPEGERAIAADANRFVASSYHLFCSEYPLK